MNIVAQMERAFIGMPSVITFENALMGLMRLIALVTHPCILDVTMSIGKFKIST